MVYMTKYEKVRIIGIRAKQISMGAKPLVIFEDMVDSISIAEKEFEEKKIPVIIVRKHPNGKTEKFRACDMDYIE
jgi:DNA-directed RNA polymerase subunit K/omega